MKKYLSVLLLIVCITPSVTYAAWWNPFTWSIFQKKEVVQQMQITGTEAYINTSVEVEKIKSADEKIEELQKQLDDLKNKQVNSNSSTTSLQIKKNVPTESAKPVSKPAPTISITQKPLLEENFHDQLVALYNKKIFFLERYIAGQELSKVGLELSIKDAKKDVVSFVNNLISYGSTYSPTLITVTENAINFWKYEIEVRLKLLEISDDNIETWSKVKMKLENELADISSKKIISETEYKFREIELEKLINEDDFKKNQSELSKNNIGVLSKLNSVDEEYRTLMLSVATKEKSENDIALAAVRSEIEALKRIPVYVPPQISTTQMMPTSIRCEVTYDTQSRYPSTTCIESPSMKSMRCDTSYDVNRNESKNCYFVN